MELDYDITPIGMLNNARVWHSLYRQNIILPTPHKIVAIYCMFICLEMILKAYLMLLNKDYWNDDKLKSLSHKFKNILNALKNETNSKLTTDVEAILNKYNLLEFDVNSLRYPKKADLFPMHSDFLLLDNSIDEMFEKIETEISLKAVNSL